jgi:hypothetical protein
MAKYPQIIVKVKMDCPSPNQIKKYLEAKGWQILDFSHDSYSRIFIENSDLPYCKEEPYFIILDDCFSDYGHRCANFLSDFALIEKRTEAEILTDILKL